MTDQILSELAQSIGGALGHPEPGKHPFQESAYTSPGHHPFVCMNCEHWTHPTSDHTGYCDLVVGPYDGDVGPNDTCKWWHAGPALLHGSHPMPAQMMGDHQEGGAEPESEQEDVGEPQPEPGA